jgi:phosphatidylglycerophosphate synthase
MLKTSSPENWKHKVESKEKVDAGKITHSRFLSEEVKRWWIYDFMGPLERFLVQKRISPNALSVAGLIINTISAVLIGLDFLIVGGWLLFLAGSFDFLDGRVARATQQVSLSGGFFDSVLDRYMDLSIFFGLAFLFRESPAIWLVYLCILGSVTTSYIRAKSESLGVTCSEGAMQRPERIFYIGAGCVISGYYEALRFPFESADYSHHKGFLIIVLGFIAVVSNYVAAGRFYRSFKELKNKA